MDQRNSSKNKAVAPAAQSGHTHLMLQPRGSSALCRGLGRGGGAVSSTSGGVAAGRFQFFSTPPRPRPGTRVLARVRARGVVPPGQNRPTATLAGALSLNASSGLPSAWTFHGTHAFFRLCAGVCFVSTGGRRGYCHRSDPRGWRRDGKRVARAQSRKLAGGSTAGTVDGVGTAARFRQVAFLFDAATFPQRSEFEHGVVMVCLQG